VATIAFVVASYAVMFMGAHPIVDTRLCVARLDDAMFRLIPFHPTWFLITHEVYYALTLGGLVAMGLQARRGDHRFLVRFGLACGFMGLCRSVTLLLLPLCRSNIVPGTAVLAETPMVDLGPVSIPFRLWATNDLIFSGHACEFLLMTFATWGWPRWWRRTLIGFQIVQAIALLGSRDHYLVDIVLAVPFAVLCDRLAIGAMSFLRHRWPVSSPQDATKPAANQRAA
jgi:hypothetical protein